MLAIVLLSDAVIGNWLRAYRMIIGKLYMVTSVITRSIISDNAGELGEYIGTLRQNDIVLFLGKNSKFYQTTWLKILTSDGIVGYVSNYDCNNWQLVETV